CTTAVPLPVGPSPAPSGTDQGPGAPDGIPPAAVVTDEEQLATGALLRAGYVGGLFDEPGRIGIWRSPDAHRWHEVFLGEELWWWENDAPRLALARTEDGIVAVGTSCRERCRPIALRSPDGWSWQAVAVPVRPRAPGAPEPAGRLHAATLDVPESGSGINDVIVAGSGLVAVGWAEVAGHEAHATSWTSTDGGSTWRQAPADPADLGGRALHMQRAFRLGSRLAAGGFEQGLSGGIRGAVWDSADGIDWQRKVAPGEWWISNWAVCGGTMYATGPDVAGSSTLTWASEDPESWRVVPEPYAGACSG
ncbi:MAG: hypothetical protein ACRDKW_17760, partial [Actinomycetota bacterium]